MKYSQTCFNDTHLIWTPYYYRQFALSLGKESPYIFLNTDNPFNTDTFHGPLSVCTNGVWLYNLTVFLKQKVKCKKKNMWPFMRKRAITTFR